MHPPLLFPIRRSLPRITDPQTLLPSQPGLSPLPTPSSFFIFHLCPFIPRSTVSYPILSCPILSLASPLPARPLPRSAPLSFLHLRLRLRLPPRTLRSSYYPPCWSSYFSHSLSSVFPHGWGLMHLTSANSAEGAFAGPAHSPAPSPSPSLFSPSLLLLLFLLWLAIYGLAVSIVFRRYTHHRASFDARWNRLCILFLIPWL